MARIEFEETNSSLKLAAIWGGAALILCLVKPPLPTAIVVCAIIGALNGAANLWLLSKMKPERMCASNWIGVAALVAAVLSLNRGEPRPPMGGLQCLALGCVCVAMRSAVFAFCKQSVVDALNKKYGRSLATLEDDESDAPKVHFENADQAYQAFLTVLPAGLREEYGGCITQAIIANHAAPSGLPFQSALGGSPVLPVTPQTI